MWLICLAKLSRVHSECIPSCWSNSCCLTCCSIVMTAKRRLLALELNLNSNLNMQASLPDAATPAPSEACTADWLSAVVSTSQPARAGLRNASGEYNCFLNVLIQCLRHCAFFCQAIMQWPQHAYQVRQQSLAAVFTDADVACAASSDSLLVNAVTWVTALC